MAAFRLPMWGLSVLALIFFVAPSMAFAQDATDAEPAPKAAAAPEKTEGDAASAPATGAAGETAAPGVAIPANKKLSDLWDDLLYYIRVARPDLAKSYAQAILDSKAEPREIFLVSEANKESQAILDRGAKLAGMKDLVAKLRQTIEQGFQNERQDPKQIEQAIQDLGQSLRAFERAKARLISSGEYAIPQMIQKLLDPNVSDTLKDRIRTVLPVMGKDVVRPLTTALDTTDENLQRTLVTALGQIMYKHAAPRLKELSEQKGVLEQTRQAAKAALTAVAGKAANEESASQLYYELALSYYNQDESLRPDPRYPTANIWSWSDNRLEYTPVPREIFCDVYAMRMARTALQLEAKFYPAVSLWVAADIKREADLPAGEKDATHGTQPDAAYYAMASGAKYLQEVLARALGDKSAAVAIGAIDGLARTAGVKSLVEPVGSGAQPLVEALAYPDREVRFLAAVSLAGALPDKRFAGSAFVTNVLNEALRQSGVKTALVISPEEKRLNSLKDTLRAQGFDVIEGADAARGLAAARSSTGLDLILLGSDVVPGTIMPTLRSDILFATVPVVIAGDTGTLRDLARTDGKMAIAAGEKADDLKKAIEEAATLAGGKAFSSEKQAAWAARAADAVRLLGLTGNSVFDLTLNRDAVIAALAKGKPAVQIAAAGALAVMPAAEAQQAIAVTACDPKTEDAVRVKAFGFLSESIRRFGNQLGEKNAQAVLDVVNGKGSAALLNSAAQALGSMNLPSDQIKSLIVGSGAAAKQEVEEK